ncbi:phylloplanin-like [Andrographis paniculata]|uniref:phylloplanin-like n=1 Tax=Andrographis paniculata TaxID=175694 RepID=UPI0021E96F2B|nr:phylloplanin-like [Andrographis paniculata]
MAFKLILLLCVLIAVPVAQAQPLGGLLGNLLGLLRIQGIVYCTPNGNIGINGTSTPVFANAGVQLQCGGNVVSTTTTNGAGVFSFLLDPLNMALNTLTNKCTAVVNTPLASCNASLPSVGELVSNLQFVGSTFSGLLKIFNIGASDFQFNANVK